MNFLKILFQRFLSEFAYWTLLKIWTFLTIIAPFIGLGGLSLVAPYFVVELLLLICIVVTIILFYFNIKEEKIQHISLLDAAQILSIFDKDMPEELRRYITSINSPDLIEEFVFERDHPDKIYEETLPKITVGLINLTLHLCKENNINVYGKVPSSTNYTIIPYEKIQFFSEDYTNIYSDRSRKSQENIYQDISIIKKDLERVINTIDMAQFKKIFKEAIYGH